MDKAPCPNVSGMRRSPRLVAPAMLAALLLSGCVPSDPTPTPPPTPDATPVFESEEEALAAAEEAYGNYLAVATRIIHDGGADPDRLRPYVAQDIFERDRASFEQFASNGWHGTGDIVYSLTLQQYDDRSVVVYACEDLSATDVLDSSGISVVPADRRTTFSYEVAIDAASGRIDSKEVWDGEGVC